MEIERYIHTLGDTYRISNKTTYIYDKEKKDWNIRTGWQLTNSLKGEYYGDIYPGYKYEIKQSNLKYCDLDMIEEVISLGGYRGKKRGTEVWREVTAYSNNPALEMYVKCGMKSLVESLIYKNGKIKYINRRGNTLRQQLRLRDNGRLKEFIREKGDIKLLAVYQMEQKLGKNWSMEEKKFIRERLDDYQGEKKMAFMLQYMTLKQFRNRFEKYASQKGFYGRGDVMTKYYDYLQMRQEFGYDMSNEVYLHPKNLIQKHQEMVDERNARADAERIVKKNKEFVGIARRYKKLLEKFEWHYKGYVIRPAKNAGEIITEGRKLHHCVGGDNYLSKHSRGQTTICFLRHEETPEVPYYTIEIKNSTNEIIQWYAAHDKKPDEETIGLWLDDYVKHLKNPKKELQVAG